MYALSSQGHAQYATCRREGDNGGQRAPFGPRGHLQGGLLALLQFGSNIVMTGYVSMGMKNRFRRARELAGLSLKQAALHVGIPTESLHTIERECLGPGKQYHSCTHPDLVCRTLVNQEDVLTKPSIACVSCGEQWLPQEHTWADRTPCGAPIQGVAFRTCTLQPKHDGGHLWEKEYR